MATEKSFKQRKAPEKKDTRKWHQKFRYRAGLPILAVAAGLVGMKINGDNKLNQQVANVEAGLPTAYPDLATAGKITVSREGKYGVAKKGGKDCCVISYSQSVALGKVEGIIDPTGLNNTYLDRNEIADTAYSSNYDRYKVRAEAYEQESEAKIDKAICVGAVINFDGTETTAAAAFNYNMKRMKKGETPLYICKSGMLSIINGKTRTGPVPSAPKR